VWLVSAHSARATSAAAASQTQHGHARCSRSLAGARQTTPRWRRVKMRDYRVCGRLHFHSAALHGIMPGATVMRRTRGPPAARRPVALSRHVERSLAAAILPSASFGAKRACCDPARARGGRCAASRRGCVTGAACGGPFGAGADLFARSRCRSGSRLRRPSAACARRRGAPRSRALSAQRRRKTTRRRRSRRPHCPHSPAAPTAAPSLSRAPSSAALASVRRTSARTWCSATARTLLCARAALPHGPS